MALLGDRFPPSTSSPASAVRANGRQSQSTDVILLTCLYVAECSLVLMALALHKGGDRALIAWASSAAGGAFAVGLLGLLLAAAWIRRRYVRSRRTERRGFGHTVAMNVITVALILVPLEVALRVLSRDGADAPLFTGTVLLPRSWERTVAHNRELLEKASGDLSYLVYDATLGWTVGPNRQGAEGLYLSSAEGLRAARQGVVLAGAKQKPRVALVGDSYTFAEGVAFEHSWGHLLEAASGLDVQVLNFGVGGYGVDQAYLRFRQDVFAWKPDVVILGFPMHDLHRTMTLYPFINWPEWGIPFSKPRLVRSDNGLRTLNVPTLPPQTIWAKRSVTDLPFLEYDEGYASHHWRSSAADALYISRWLFTYFPRWTARSSYTSADEMIQLNGAILRAFIHSAKENGMSPIVAFFPSRPEVRQLARGETTEWQRQRERLAVPLLDTTPCLTELRYEDVFLPSDPHYSPRGNAAVAKCLATVIQRILEESSPKEGTAPRTSGTGRVTSNAGGPRQGALVPS